MKDPHDIRKAAIEDEIIARSEEALPYVAGRMEMTHADFQRGCMVLLAEAQTHINPETFLIQLLCEAVRCSRECCEVATVRPDAAELAQLRTKCERLEGALVEIAEAYANNEPISAKWAKEALAAIKKVKEGK